MLLMMMMMIGIHLCVLLKAINGVGMGTVALIPGHFRIGALFNIHIASGDKSKPFQCGDIDQTYGIQSVEAALITVNQINDDDTILPGIYLVI